MQACHDVWREMTLCFRGGSYDVDSGVARMRTQLPVPAFNGVSVVELPWNVQLRSGHSAELDDALADLGLVVTEDIYERLGFATVEHWRQWMPQHLVEAH